MLLSSLCPGLRPAAVPWRLPLQTHALGAVVRCVQNATAHATAMTGHTTRAALANGLSAHSMHIGSLFEPNTASQDPYTMLEQQLGPFSKSPTVNPVQPVVVVISGPSGARCGIPHARCTYHTTGVGKDAVIKRLEHLRPDLHFVVTATSRPRRPSEVHGVDYHFVSKEQFEEWIAGDELLEHAVVYGEYKGIPRQQVLDALARGTDVVLRIDVQGAATMRRLLPGVVSIFIAADTEAELVQRLLSRKTETMDRMAVRVETARQEMQRMVDFDYIVVNRDGQLDETARQLGSIIDAAKLQAARRLPLSA